MTLKIKRAILGVATLLLSSQSIMAQPGYITTIAGTGTAASTGDGGLASVAAIYHPADVFIDASGNIFFSEYEGQKIRKITPSGIISTVAGTGVAGYSGDGGPATAARFNGIFGITGDAAGNIYACDFNNQRIRKIDASGTITTIAGTGAGGYSGDGGAATLANIWQPEYPRIDNAGNLCFTDNQNHRVRKISSTGVISTIAGNGTSGYTGDGGAATLAALSFPGGICFDNSGNMFIADNNNVIRKINSSGIISTIAGTGASGYSGDGGPATAAKMRVPQGMIVDAAGNLLVAETNNHCIRKINTAGYASTYAGIGAPGFAGDGAPATAAKLNTPCAVGLDAAGNLFVVDVYNHRLRRVEANANTAPSFTFAPSHYMHFCTNEAITAAAVDSLLRVVDVDAGQTLTWSVTTPASHGIVSGSYSVTSTGGTLTPSGFVYTPTSGYTGTDMFQLTVSDGIASGTITINMQVDLYPTAGTISGKDSVCAGDTVHLATTATGGTWSVTNSTLASVSPSGVVTGIASGIDSAVYTVTNSCGTAVTKYPLKVRTFASCNTMVNAIADQNAVSIYPNPSHGNFSIALPAGSTESASVIFTDITGRKIKSVTVVPGTTMQIVLDKPAGIYFATVITTTGNTTQKITITP